MRLRALMMTVRLAAWVLAGLLSMSPATGQEGAAGSTPVSPAMMPQDPLSQDEVSTDVASQSEDPEQAEDPVLAAQRQARLARAQALQSQISDLSLELDSYDPALIELQDDLGRTWLELEQFELAHGVLEQAMQLVRVNDGLYGERQVGLLKSLVQANLGLQAWEQVDIYAHLLLDLQARQHEPGTAVYADALLSFSDWRLQASRHNLLIRPGSTQSVQMLQDLQEQHEAALGFARERQDVGQQWSLLYAMASTEVEMARQYNYQSLSDFDSPAPRYVSQTVCRTVPNGSGGFQRVCWQERVSNPDYLYSASNQRRTQAERARIGLQATVREMEALLAENPEFASTHANETGRGLHDIEQALKELQRNARRSALQRW